MMVLRACSTLTAAGCGAKQALRLCFDRQLSRRADALVGRRCLSRRAALALPLLLAACVEQEGAPVRTMFEPLRYDYLPPIRLNVATIDVETQFIPAGVAPDVSMKDPVQPVDALRTMANDRLQAFGTANRAVFAIQDASLTQANDVIRGVMSVSVSIMDNGGAQLGYATARVERTHTGRTEDIRATLYDMTKAMMDDMNVEFEYQVRHNLKDWLASPTAPDTPVQQDSLDQSSGAPPSQPSGSLGTLPEPAPP